MKKILITRTLTDQSPIKSLQSDSVHVIGESFLTFEAIEITHWETGVDLVFFYSQRCVEFSFLNEHFQAFCSSKRIGTFGPATADYLIDHYDITPELIGNGTAEDNLSQISMVEPTHVLFVQGEQSLRRLQTSDDWQTPYSEVIPYRSIDREVMLTDIPDIVIFTSPLNVDHYCSQYTLFEDQQIWAIGPTTANAIEAKYPFQIHLPPNPTEASLATAIGESLEAL